MRRRHTIGSTNFAAAVCSRDEVSSETEKVEAPAREWSVLLAATARHASPAMSNEEWSMVRGDAGIASRRVCDACYTLCVCIERTLRL